MIKTLYSILLVAFMLGCLYACDHGIEVRQDYDFSLSSWHLPSEIRRGERVEMRLTLEREGDFEGAKYRIGHIQTEGTGEVCDTEGGVLVSREMRELSSIPELDARDPRRQVFTLFYRSTTDKKSEIDFIVGDNAGQERMLRVSFTVRDDEEAKTSEGTLAVSARID